MGPEPVGATPIEEDELADLIPNFVATSEDLNIAEYENIAKAIPDAFEQARREGPQRVLRHEFLFNLHRRMFEDVWRWAGTQRRRITNIGIDPLQIPTQIKQTFDDAVFWHENETYSIDERAARIHCRLVAIHPFPNGNGRCTRLVADLYLVSIDQPQFTWGTAAGRLDEDGVARRVYIGALLEAVQEKYEPLIAFARS
ncbi:MAG: mobile mystery protein B [Acidimicrobiaceae bacterium]|nr:mobile mystery protein B [Acidimicrobiaceae bacterium]